LSYGSNDNPFSFPRANSFGFYHLEYQFAQKTLQTRGVKALDDEKYFELKYKLEFLTASFWVMVAIGGLLGYNTLKDAKEEVKTEFSNELEALTDQLEKVKEEIGSNDSTAKNLRKEFPELEKLVSQLQARIKLINSKNILKQNYYVVRYIDKPDWKKDVFMVFFKDLKTSSGDRLPKFVSSPVVMVSANAGSLPTITNITKESFEMYYHTSDFGTADINFLIFETTTFDNSFDNTFK